MNVDLWMGKLWWYKAHPRFRLFLIVDSRLGEVSRAMRNRGVEIYMLDSEYAMTDATSQLSIDMSMTYQDAKKLVILSGIPGPSLVTSICNVHAMMRSYKESILGNPFVTHRELVQWIRLLYMLLERGANMTWSLHYSWQESYADAFDHVESKLAAEKMFHSSFVYNNKALSEFVPGGWPNPLILSEYCKQSMETMVRRDGSYVEFVLMNSLSFQIYMDIIPLAQSENRSAEVHQLLERNKLWAPYFPESLFRFFLDPRVNTFDQLDKSPISQGYFKDIEKVIPHAVFWMMEQTCFSDLNLCLHWLCILSTKLASRFPILDRMITVIKKEIQHPVAMQIHTALEDLKYSKILQILVPQQFLTSNSAVENKVVLWFGKLGALRRTLLQWQTEDEVLNSANGNGYSTEATLIQRSYWHYHEGSDQSRTLMIDRVVIWLYPLLVSLRQVENEVLASDIALWNSDVEKVYAEVHNAHEPFWQSLQISCVDTALLRFWWDTTKNSVRRLVELPELKSSMSKAYQGLIHLGRMVDEALGVQKVSKPLLWKYGGHPWIPHSRELYEQVKHLANLCNSYWGKKQFEKDVDEINPACADKEIRLLTLEGASMIIWLDQEACKSRRSESVDGIGLSPDMVNQETASVFQMLLKKMESEDHKCPKFLGYQVVPGLENGKKVHREFEQTSFDQFPKKSLCSTAMRSFWLDLLPLLDHISVYLDAALLARLLPITAQWLFADKSGEMLAHEVPRIGHVVEYSLKCASRSPLDFVPHQHLLWMLSSKALTMPVRSITHEILFNWHAALWDKTRIVRDKIPQSFSTMAGAAQLFQASKARLLCNAMDTNVPLKDYYGKLTQLRVALAQGWDHAKHIEDVFKDDLARASGVIQQIIFAHHNSFAAKDFQMINVNFNNMHKDIVEGGGDRVARQHLQEVELLLGHSTHTDFIKSLKTWILPCIHLLYGTAWTAINYYDMLSKRGELWVLIGQLRLQLLISGAEVDPNAKYLLRYAHLSDRLVDVELEIKVCRESMLLVRGSANMGCLKKLLQTQNDLHKSRDALRVKLVPRPDAPQFQKLREEICFFWGSLASPDRVNGLVNLLHAQLQKNFDLEYVIKEANTWQENADSFIGVLAEQFSDFRDLVQPIQLGVYEIKFGLSLLLASRLGLETFGDNGGSYKADRYAGILCHLMQYPRNPYLDADKDSGSFEDKMEQKLCFGLPFSEQLLKGASSDTFLSPAIVQLSDDVEKREFIEVELQVAVLRVSLLHMIQQFRFTRVLDKNTMMVLQTMFRRLVELWKKTRSWQLDQELEITESLKLRNSTCTMSRETELEEESFKAMFPNYWNGGEQDKDSLHVINEDAVLSEEDEQRSKTRNWSEPLVLSVQDCLLKDVISTHKQIFMCYSPFVKRNMALVGDDEQMTQAFALSYDTGRTLCTALGHVLPATVDDEVASGHLMKLGTLIHYLSSADSMKNPPSSFNIYKDSNPSEIANMLEPLASLLQRVTNLLIEWPEHPVLMQIAQTIKLLSSISLQSPVMKAVTGLEMILAKAQLWEENASKLYSISAELDELSRWVIRWRKQELASWPTLLDGIYHAHEISADKLWFSLYDLLHQHAEADLKGEIETVIESMEEFMLCSPLGEFRRRLDHVLAFYGQFSYMSFLNCSLFRISLERIRSILFNVYHYYSHFLPILQESLSTSRTAVDTEMKSFIQLYKWEDRSYSSLASSAEKAHRKVIKVMRKYDQLLKRPISEILDQHMSSSSEFQGVQDLDLRQHASIPESRKSLKTLETGDVDVAQTRVEISKKELAERWNKYSMTEMVDLSKSLPLFSTDVIRTFLQHDSVKLSEKISECLGVHIFSDIGCHVWQEGAIILEDLGTAVIVRSAELQNEKNRMVKKKAFIDLLKRLKQIGLSHHKSVIPKDQRAPRSWFLQAPSEYDCWMHIFGDSLSKHYVGLQDLEVCLVESEDVIWKRASAYYFNNLELLGHLEKKSLMYNKDLNLQEVEVSKRYAEHLLYLQQQQREKVYNFSKKLGALMTITTHSRYFVGRDKMDVTFPPQVFVRKWLWKQKILLESLCQVSSETVLFFKTCEGLGTESRNYKTLCSTISSALQSGKGLLDDILVPGNTFHSPENLESSWPIVISEQMVRIIKRNFQMLREMHTTVSKSAAANDQSHKKGVPGLDPLIKLIQKGMKLADKFEEERKKSLKARQGVTHVQQEPIQFLKSYDNVITEILLAIQNVSKINEIQKASHETVEPLDFDEHSEGNFQTWETTLEKFMSALRLDTVYTAALAAVSSAAKISDDSEISEDMRNMLGRQIGCMHVLLEILQVAGLRVLFDYMYMHRAVAKLAYILLNLFISLYSKGFCRAQEEDEPLQESKLENAGGTGMGEGEGMKDVSEDIEQEEQLVGTEKDKATTSEKSHDKLEKGIEMDEDFTGDMFDISEDESSQDTDSENADDEKIESKMGDVDEKDEIVDERFWNSGEDKDVSPPGQEKYEKDAPVSGKDSEDVELRGKENHDEDTTVERDAMDRRGHHDAKKTEREEDNDVEEEDESPNLNEKDAYEEGSGLKPDTEDISETLSLDAAESDGSERGEDEGMNEGSLEGDDAREMDSDENVEVSEAMETTNLSDLEAEGGTEQSHEACNESPNEDEKRTDETAVTAFDKEGEKVEDTQRSDMHKPHENVETMGPRPLEKQLDAMKLDSTNTMPNRISEAQIPDSSEALGAPLESKLDSFHANMSNSESQHLDLPEASRTAAALAVAPDLNTKKSHHKTSTPFQDIPQEPHSLDRLEANPLRNLGDFLKKWKERIRVVEEDTHETNGVEQENGDKVEETGMEYEYVSKEVDSNLQAIGSATEDQTQQSTDLQKEKTTQELDNEVEPIPLDINDGAEELQTIPQSPVKGQAQVYPAKRILGDKGSIDTDMQDSLDEEFNETGRKEVGPSDDFHGDENITESFISIRVQNLEHVKRGETLSRMSRPDKDVQVLRRELETNFMDGINSLESAHLLWQKYEHLTSRLSQELTEQLRLILEPTLATKLQGDYRSGKRINMKKVIPYVASDFRKDKIWLRRTKPSKRQYQVVLAIDDSRSMSESHCGHMALEALITICRAMSQLEIGQMAVASFGEKGNVHLLHAFDQPFTSDAGVQMISQFSFKQDNTIADEPMVDLLHFLTRMLDDASRNATRPSGQNVLQQLVLIIADGRFHEKESLRRVIHEAITRRQLLAFIILDNPRESLLDMQSVSFSGGAPAFSKYLDAFPFPYYILLKDIQALPRTLANLLRQWFELMQQTS
ncbi:hypothetical protein O6H91_06G059100 [Diphasiastrum complanatum]|uniref:Uncharacterized protein n=1 Tax=Diphasiastrum complanatum TaxID=34168 RepID=A0ACC2DDY6_DIPCM|nr:hypothetical protein O6H91_06G059100 [Diphasiastrum complanatum]